MLNGILLTLSACLLWGFVFVIPTFITEFSSIEIALGRYFFFGALSLLFCLGIGYRKLLLQPLTIWIKALWFTLISNVLYYTSIILAIQYSSASMTALIAGIAPVTISLYGNIKNTECRFQKLILPAILIALGLVIVNIDILFENSLIIFSFQHMIGIFFAFFALMAWTWFAVENAQFLKAYPAITHFEWTTMLGVATIAWVVSISLFLGIFFIQQEQIQKYFVLTTELKTFLIATAFLGCLSSWLGSYLWNAGSSRLPVSFGGLMTIFETIFGLSFVYLIEKRIPSSWECLGIALMLLAVIYSMQVFAKMNKNFIPDN